MDELIEERAQKLRQNPLMWNAVRPLLYKMLGYDIAREMADVVDDKTGWDAFAYVSQRLNLSLKIHGLENVPRDGRCVIISNHPTGLADGVAVYDALKDIRRDHIFMANADALRVMPKCEDLIIPVEWVTEKRTREKTRKTLFAAKEAFNAERAIVVFPAGRIARLRPQGLVEPSWMSTGPGLAKKYDAPLIPLNIRARNSLIYYAFAIIHNELRDVTLFKELLNKSDQLFELTFGAPVSPDDLPKDTEAASLKVREIVLGITPPTGGD